MNDQQPVLEISGLGVTYVTHHYSEKAVEDVEFRVLPGQVVALVGESGSGKTTVAKSIVGLLPHTAQLAEGSRIALAGTDVVGASEHVLEALRGSVVSLVPQDPRRSLHPLKRIGTQIGEVLVRHRICAKSAVQQRVEQLLEKVGIDSPQVRSRQYPHEFSGGMLQRVLIAIAIAAKPKLIVADEPTSALDVTVQKQVLTLLTDLVAEDGISILLVTHDLELAAQYSDLTVILRNGRLVERRTTADLFAGPATEYGRALLQASPVIEIREPRLAGESKPLLSIESVVKEFTLHGGGWLSRPERFRPVDDVSFTVPTSGTVALVGESGAGKTTVSRLVLGLDRPTSGRVVFEDRDVHRLGASGRGEFRRSVQLVPQNPASSFDPRYSVAEVIGEPLRYAGFNRSAIRNRVRELLDQVGLPESFASKGALDLSGGQQQRVAIARAISLEPRLIVCDEPTSALDVTVQARIITLLKDLQQETGVSYLFISHNLAVVSEVADQVVVLRKGRVVEAGSAAQVLGSPADPYTQELIDSVPSRH